MIYLDPLLARVWVIQWPLQKACRHDRGTKLQFTPGDANLGCFPASTKRKETDAQSTSLLHEIQHKTDWGRWLPKDRRPRISAAEPFPAFSSPKGTRLIWAGVPPRGFLGRGHADSQSRRGSTQLPLEAISRTGPFFAQRRVPRGAERDGLSNDLRLEKRVGGRSTARRDWVDKRKTRSQELLLHLNGGWNGFVMKG
ncbi:hypothetical protein HJFPF1_10206 [Paramyrothecium foliicola]|nr:hypothetical protein HJFPF1_10206 [Paramyrothecium foliicola]